MAVEAGDYYAGDYYCIHSTLLGFIMYANQIVRGFTGTILK